MLSFSLMEGQEEDLKSVEVLQALIPPFMREFCCAAIPHAEEVTERMDLLDEAGKTLTHTVLQADFRYHYFSATIKFAPEHIKQIAILVFKALAGVAKANPTVAFFLVVVAALSIFTW